MMKHSTNSKRNKIQFSTDLLEEVASEEFDSRKIQVARESFINLLWSSSKSMQSIAK